MPARLAAGFCAMKRRCLEEPARPPRLLGAPPRPDRSLQALRRRRGFDVERCVEAKVALLNAYLTESGLKACVVGVSGGVDSAVTLGLACRAAAQPGSPIREVVAALIPMFVSDGATNQDIALARGRRSPLASAPGASPWICRAATARSRALSTRRSAPWAAPGPLASSSRIFRTPALYYLTSLLAQQAPRGSPRHHQPRRGRLHRLLRQGLRRDGGYPARLGPPQERGLRGRPVSERPRERA